MERNDFIELPIWAKKLIGENICPNCQTAYTEEDVAASGNRRKDGGVYFFFEVECSRCGNPAMSLVTTRPCDSAQLCVYLMDLTTAKMDGKTEKPAMPAKVAPSRQPKYGNTVITNEEFKVAHQIVKTAKDHIEFLKKIGLTPKEIAEYAKPRRKK